MDAEKIKKQALAELEKAANASEIEKLQVKYLGRKGEISRFLRTMKDLPVEKRRELGPKFQELKIELENLFSNRLSVNKETAKRKGIDLTAPGKKVSRGHFNPLTIVDADIRKIFTGMNFSVVEGPEVETEYYNFDALNVPAFHPAREMWDTFWLKARTDTDDTRTKTEKNKSQYRSVLSQHQSALLLRTHTSPVQMRYMEKNNPPFQIIAPGRCFRYEATDASHEVNFYQLEGLMVGKNINLANFKFVVEEFFKKFFVGQKIEFRYRPSYFPFVEPGIEVIIKLNNKWLEVMGAGMVHPRVFEYAGYNPRDWQGFAFGVGIDRLAMIKYKIPDIRMFYSGDLRFIRQF